MPKYETMLILDPKADIKIVESLASEVFKDGVESVKKYDQTQLAYPIKKSTTALYVLMYVNASPELIKEFTRKANNNQKIWRFLTINLDSERQHKIKKSYRFGNKREDRKKFYGDRQRRFDNKSSVNVKETIKTTTDKE